MKLSVVLATHNESLNLGRCLESVTGLANEIVVVDGESTDNTQEIAKSYGAKVFVVPNQTNFHINKNIAISKAKYEWILQLDADEVVSPQLKSEILGILTSNTSKKGYWCNRKNWFLTRFLTKGGQYPDPTIRLYRNGFGKLPAKDVHEQAVINGEVGFLSHDLLHFRDTSFEKYLDGFNRYSSFISLQLSEMNIKFGIIQTIFYVVIKPIKVFTNIYIRHLGVVDGLPGFIFALYSGLIYPVAYIKYWQHRFYPQ